jgi:hypothetical protein
MRIFSHCFVDLDAGDWECNVILDGDGTDIRGITRLNKLCFIVLSRLNESDALR